MNSNSNAHVLLKVSHLKKKYDSDYIINDLSFEAYRGEFISILGPSGCGKSTLLQLIAGFLEPDEGEIYIADQLVSSATTMVGPDKRGVNMVYQNYALWPHMNVIQHIDFGLKQQKLSKSEREHTAQHLIEMLRLQGLEQRLPSALSGGQQQRVAIARALSTAPKLLLLDEPMSNLDSYLRLQMRFELKTLFNQLGTTVLYVTHEPEEAMSMADRLLLMKDGRVEQIDTPQMCYYRPLSPWVAGLLGAINSTTSSEIDQSEVEVKVGEQRLRGTVPVPETYIPAGNRVELRSRPEDIQIFLEKPKSIPENYSLIRALVRYSSFEGKHWRCTLFVEPDLIFYALHNEYIPPNTEIWATSAVDAVYIYPTSS